MKEFFSRQVTNKMIWGTLIAAVAIIMITTIATVIIVHYKTTSTQVGAVPSENESSNTKNDEENVVDMNTLTDVSQISEEELQKLNEKELEEAKKKEQEEKKNTTTTTKKQNKYYIKVNYGAQVVNVYTYDKDGKYTVPVKAFVCSTGTETPRSGVYKIPAKITWCKMFGDVYAHYCTQIVGNILFHSVPYLEKNNHTLEYWAYDKLGTKASMGCIRLTTRDAKWIFENVSIGTQVEFYSSSNPGPLGKPTAQKISNAPGDLKWWDPTDPDPSNPWKNYKPEENNTQKNEENIVANNTTTDNQTNGNSQTGNNQNSQMENTESQNNQVGNNTTTSNNQTGNNTTQNAANANNQAQNGQNNSNAQANNEQNNTNNQQQNSQNNNNAQANNEQNNTNNQQQNGQENNQMTDTQI